MKRRRLNIIIILTIFFSVIPFSNDNPVIHERKSIENFKTNSGTVESPLIYGLPEYEVPEVLDPVDSWDSATNDVIRHVCENLWSYNLSDPDLALEMRLATSYDYNPAKDEVNVILRQNVYFHDGAKFNATAVKFTFDRILYFTNATGDLPATSRLCDPASLFFNLQGVPILNKTVINSEYNVTFFLNAPNAIFISLLSYDAWAILHPDSTNATKFLELGTDILVGTGPYVYEGYTPDIQIGFHAYEDYWRGKAEIDEIIFKYYPDLLSANNALLGGEAHFVRPLTSMIDLILADPDIIVTNLNSSNNYRYYGLNNHKINEVLIRKAICYAINYSYYIQLIRQGYGIRAHQMVPPGFPYYNASFTAPTMKVSIAREAMKAARPAATSTVTAQDVGVNSTNDAAWAALDILTYKVLEHEGWTIGINMNAALAVDLNRIGISLVSDVMDWEIYTDASTHDKDRFEIFYSAWSPYYLDPFNFIEPLLSNLSNANHIQNHDAQIIGWLEDYEQETSTTLKAELLWKIQNRAINEIYVELPILYDTITYAHHKNLTGFPYNVMKHLYLYPCNGDFTVPASGYPPTSNHPEDFITSLGGSETINWILNDDFGEGQYRVWVNDASNYYLWVDWTPWTNSTPLNVPINRTVKGVYNYTIEYYDDYIQSGVVDIVIVTIIDMIPSSNHPSDLFTALGGSETIDWILYDDSGGGQYRVWANDINGNYYIWVDWTQWTNNTLLSVQINRTSIGIYNYTIEYYDNNAQLGNPDTVIVVITEDEVTPSFIPGPNIILISMISLLAIFFIVNKNLRKRD